MTFHFMTGMLNSQLLKLEKIFFTIFIKFWNLPALFIGGSFYNLDLTVKMWHQIIHTIPWTLWSPQPSESMCRKSHASTGSVAMHVQLFIVQFFKTSLSIYKFGLSVCLFVSIKRLNRSGPIFLWDITWPQGRFMNDVNFKYLSPSKFDRH